MRHDVAMILVQLTRDRPDCGLKVEASKLDDVATLVARELSIRIGGRYVPKRDNKARRDAEVWADFNGKNHQEVIRKHKISRRLLYSILARIRRSKGLSPR